MLSVFRFNKLTVVSEEKIWSGTVTKVSIVKVPQLTPVKREKLSLDQRRNQ